MSRVVILVTNDIEADQRVAKVAGSMAVLGYDISIVGVMRSYSSRSFRMTHKLVRFHLLFQRGPLFYLSFNIRAFFHLLFHSYAVVVACDTDTLLAARLAKLVKGFKLVFDAHELFPDVPELVGDDHRLTRAIWKMVERSCIPGVDTAITVSEGVAKEYARRYGKSFSVVRNVPLSISGFNANQSNQNVIIYQGAINTGRGLELLCEAMHFLPEAELWIVGTGYLDNTIARLVQPLVDSGQIKLLGRIAPEILRGITTQASVGVSLEEDLGLSYRYCLPNKLFDYIFAGIPVLVSDLPEMRKLVEGYSIGVVLMERTPQALANTIRGMLSDLSRRKQWQQNLAIAAIELCWEKEQEKFFRVWKHDISSPQ
ncbi:glycosyltransferase [Williamwhitmania taraxaci]|uniref:Glycosyltransferase involved in cell wall bisynthesis n=1 Tax=Williamwhitmania taraxaci TaxID=1640674 RepID=A0A1G6GUA2_9BACT|nr:glycosyltransferase [Williamwhitmania taraxaci]SDB85265.1 Glycosyltransferase involved in cell wall bisynthesis [Williamwhitmania taraxaci]